MRPVTKPKGTAHKLPRRKRNSASQRQASARARTVDIRLARSQLRAIRRREDRLLRLEHSVARSFAEADSESTALRAVIRAVCEIEGWECGRYFRVDEKAGVLRFADAWGVKDPRVERFIKASRPLTYRPGVGLSGKAWQSGKPLWSTDVTKDSRTSSGSSTGLSHEMGTHATFVFPVFSDGKPIGVLSFASRKAREPVKRLLEAIHAIGSQIGQFVQRKQAEAVLRGSEARFRSLTSLSSDWYWEQDENFRFVEITGRNISSAGTGLPHRYLGKARWETGLDLVEGTWDEHRALLQSHQPFHDVVFVRKHPAGGVHYTAVSGEPIFDAEGRFKGYRGLGRDVTGRKREETLLAMEHAVTRSLAEADSVSAGLMAALRVICESEGWECGRYFRRDDVTGAYRFDAFWNIPSPAIDRFIKWSRERSYAPGVGLVGRVGESREPLWVPNVSDDPRIAHKGLADEHGMRGAFLFPAMSEGRAVGVLAFNSREVREPDARLLRATGVIGSQIGQFLQHKYAEDALRERETRFRNLTRLSSDVYWEQDAEYRFTLFGGTGSDAIAAVTPRWIGKKRWEQDYLNMSAADWAAHIAALDARKPFSDLELCRLDDAGERIWISVSGEPVFDASGAFEGYRGVGKEITQRKREETLLAMEHAVTRCLAEADSAGTGLTAAIRAICESEDWECGRYFGRDDKSTALVMREFWHVPDPGLDRFIEQSRGLSYVAGAGLIGSAWQSGAPMWITDIARDDRVQVGIARRIGMRGTFIFPVTSGGKPIGMLSFHSKNVREPENRMLQAVRVIGSQIGQFLQRKQAEESMRDQALQQRLIAEFGQQALASPELGEVLTRAAELISATLKVDYCSVLELTAEGRQLAYRAVTGWPQEWVGQRSIPVEPGSRLDHVLEHRQPLLTEDYDREGPFGPSLAQQYGIRSAVQVPVFGRRGTFGILSAYALQQRSFTDDEVSFLRSVANILAIAIERKNAEDKLAHLAQFDAVTGLPNRYLFRDRLEQTLTQAGRNRWLLGVLFVDLDRFKAVNDTYGHGAGDKLLRETAARLKGCVRSGDTVGRLSGDEFAVVLSNLAQADDAGLVVQKIVDALAAPFEIDGHQTYVTASIGIALFPNDGLDPDDLLKNADTAMYRAKEQGRNGYQFYLPEMNERLTQRLKFETHLRGALERRQFHLNYQPKVSLETGAMTGFEALLRWRHGDLMVSPAEFIPVLEETGLIVPVGEWVLRTVCEQIRQWASEGRDVRSVAVNLSARQFQRTNLAKVVADILRETGIDPQLLELELTETLLMSDAQEAVQTLRELKTLGVRLAVDDFGTGYSSLAYLRRFPLDTLKIDRAFIRDVAGNAEEAALTRAIINLAHDLKLKVVAEGVETEAQLNLLRLHGCDEMQGFYFSRPLPVEECTRALAEDRRLQSAPERVAPSLPVLLLVDDNEIDRILLEATLAREGFHIVTADCPRAALEILARDGASIVVSDHQMPEMTGVEFLSNVRKLFPGTVRIVVSGDDDRRTLIEAINNAGIHKFLSKHWDADRLRAEVREAFDRRQTASTAASQTA